MLGFGHDVALGGLVSMMRGEVRGCSTLGGGGIKRRGGERKERDRGLTNQKAVRAATETPVCDERDVVA